MLTPENPGLPGRPVPGALCRLIKADDGATAIEYALIAGIMCVAIVAGMTPIGTALGDLMQTLADAF